MSELLDQNALFRKLDIKSFDELGNEINPDKFAQYIMLVPFIDASTQQEIIIAVPGYAKLAANTLSKIIEKDLESYPEEAKVFDLLTNMLSAVKKLSGKKVLAEDDLRDVLDKVKIITSMLLEVRKENSPWATQHKWMVTVGGFSLLATVVAILIKKSVNKNKISKKTRV